MPRLWRVFASGLLFFLAFATNGFAQAVNFDTYLRAAGAGANSAGSGDFGRWKIGAYTIEAVNKKPYVSINGTKIYTSTGLTCGKGKFFIQKRDWEKNVAPIVAPQRRGVPGLRKIVIDAGHGGKDSGKVNSRGMQEKRYSLDVAQRLEKILKARGFNVVMTRRTDVFIDLNRRPEIANEAWADLFVSVHFNAAESTSARGVETWLLTPVGQASFSNSSAKKDPDRGNAQDAWNLLAAYKIHSTLVKRIDAEDRGLKRANFAVLRTLKCPGILVECGFFTNASEAALIATAARREQIALGIADGISAYSGVLAQLSPTRIPTRRTSPRAGRIKHSSL
ncbi:MAG: N-acetylmuramoyl-L-alanine amidase [Opitutae bacterium]|nr:N-acetylmuramoyl-L-alanine amidase [Opitutae bacterium]